jgi:hypothetical protein
MEDLRDRSRLRVKATLKDECPTQAEAERSGRGSDTQELAESQTRHQVALMKLCGHMPAPDEPDVHRELGPRLVSIDVVPESDPGSFTQRGKL